VCRNTKKSLFVFAGLVLVAAPFDTKRQQQTKLLLPDQYNMRRLLHDGVGLLACLSKDIRQHSSKLSESGCGIGHFSQNTQMCQGTKNCLQQTLYLFQPLLVQRDTCRISCELTCWTVIVASLATTMHSKATCAY